MAFTSREVREYAKFLGDTHTLRTKADADACAPLRGSASQNLPSDSLRSSSAHLACDSFSTASMSRVGGTGNG